jgi:hypothetical protein
VLYTCLRRGTNNRVLAPSLIGAGTLLSSVFPIRALGPLLVGNMVEPGPLASR